LPAARLALFAVVVLSGCASRQTRQAADESTILPAILPAPAPAGDGLHSTEFESVVPASFEQQEQLEQQEQQEQFETPRPPAESIELTGLLALAEGSSPALRRRGQEAAAAWERVDYIGQLPDPSLAANVFAQPIETAAGSQRANLTIRQLIPWLHRLDAQQQRAYLDAVAAHQMYEVERLRIRADVHVLWYKLFVLGKHLEVSQANQRLLKSLIAVANARVGIGKAASGDVLLGTLEYSKLEEQVVTLKQQLASTKASLNRVVGRDASTEIAVPAELQVKLPDWSHESLREQAWENQPAIAAALTRTEATRWGMEIARLKRRPDISLSASWYATDNNRPPSSAVDVGDDAWAIGAQLSIPLWRQKYDAQQREADWLHAASHASVEELMHEYDARLRDLWEQAKAAQETASLYKSTILPQAKQTLDVDQQSYSNGVVEFDRLIRDFRTVLTLELGYHRAVGQLATALARIRQATADELSNE
jgi:outer membrane protein TolC